MKRWIAFLVLGSLPAWSAPALAWTQPEPGGRAIVTRDPYRTADTSQPPVAAASAELPG